MKTQKQKSPDGADQAKLSLAVSTDPIYIDEKSASQLFGMSVGWFRKKRETGDGPPYFKDGWSVRYSVKQMEAWFEERTKESTSDYQSRFLEREQRRLNKTREDRAS